MSGVLLDVDHKGGAENAGEENAGATMRRNPSEEIP